MQQTDMEQRVVLLGEKTPKSMKSYLQGRGLKLLEIPTNTLIYDSVCTHADLYFHRVDCLQKIYMASELPDLLGEQWKDLHARLKALGYEYVCLKEPLKSTYPGNVLLNGVAFENYLIANAKTLAPELLHAYKQAGQGLLDVKQGYTKCSVAVVGKRALITEDSAIAAKAEQAGLDVLLVQKGFVELLGMPYGFIGGCCGMVEPDLLVFAGDVSAHPDYLKIEAFVKSQDVRLAWTEGPLTDFGSLFVF